MIFSCLSSVLIIIAVVCLFGLTPERVTDDLMQIITPNDTMRDKSRNLRGNKKKHRLYRTLAKMKTALAVTGKSKQFTIVCCASLVLFAAGIIVSVLIDNIFLMPVLSVAFALIPFFYTTSTLSYYEKNTKEELETALSIITTSYVRSGDVFADGINTKDEETEIEVKRKVGMVFQNPDNQIIASIVEEDVAFGPENLGIPPKEIKKRVEDALKAVDMWEFRKSTPHHLSGGQKQRIAIAGIIAMQPECLVLDEPTAMLDPKGRAEIISTLHRLNRDKGITVVLITHYMEEAENADRVIVMNDGEIIADDKPKVIFSDVERLKKVGLDVPQTAELLYNLKKNGFAVDTHALSIKEAAEQIISALHSEEK